jgi:GTP cyclohydrolase II
MNAPSVVYLPQPTPINWGQPTARARGPVVAADVPGRNAIGVHAGLFAPFRGLAVAAGIMPANFDPDLTDTGPAVPIGPFAQWSDPGRIVTFDPWGHRVAEDFQRELQRGLPLRPSIAVTTGCLILPDIALAVRADTLHPDGTFLQPDGAINVTKIAIEPVWYLPGIAASLGVDEMAMRRSIVAQSGGMYPELVSRPDLRLFLPPIGGTSVYLFGDPALLGQSDTAITCRPHDECCGSDVFGSGLCTCRPYLIHGIEECVKTAQSGGVGIVVYNRKEGRALGEVVKYLVYNARQRDPLGDAAERYFDHTVRVAGVPDLRMQELSTDVLHWLGVRHVAKWVSMSNLKSAALVQSGITIGQQVGIDPHRIAPAAQVEIHAKIASGYHAGH